MENRDENQVENIFKIVKFFDDARWINAELHENYYKAEITLNNKILTHWLRYITNRGVDADKLWGKTSYFFSKLIFEIENDKTNNFNYQKIIEIYNPKEIGSRWYTSDFFSIISTLEILKEYNYNLSKYLNNIYTNFIYPKDEEISYKMVFSLYLLTYYNIPQLDKYDISSKSEEQMIFKMAKLRAEIVNKILSNDEIFNYSYSKFRGFTKIEEPNSLSQFEKDTKDSFLTLYKWQQLLSEKRKYKKNTKKEDWDFDNIEIKESKDDYQKSKAFTLLFKPSNKLFYEKRIWCAFRDFLKNEKIKTIFIESITEMELKDALYVKNKPKSEIIEQLELPGDLWNNREIFWDCIKLLEPKNNEAINSKLRKKTNENKNNNSISPYYPEQFDITFDFIRRMCESRNCDICPFGRLLHNSSENKNIEKGKNYSKLCNENKNKLCQVALTACNYKIDCKGEENCELVKLFKV